MKTILSLILFFTVAHLSNAQQGPKTGILYGKDFAYQLTAPDGWVLDNKSGVKQGLHAVFYKEGFTWANAPVVMYANTASLKDKAHNSLEALVKYDSKKFKSSYKDLKITKGDPIKLAGKNVIVKKLAGKSYGNFEAIAYFQEGDLGIMVILSSRTQEGFESSLQGFQKLVQSYKKLDLKVINKKS